MASTFAASRPEPVTAKALQESLPAVPDIPELLNELSDLYADRGVVLQRAGKAYAFRMAPDLAYLFTRNETVKRKLPRAAIESLVVIAYHQPLTQAEIEEVRGVALSRGTLDVLLEAGWIMPRGRRRSSPGKPMLWGTTQAFFDHFDLESLTSLPSLDELKAAGFLDTRPAVTALGGRAGLFDLQDPAGGGEPEPLARDFGGTSVPEDGEDRTSLKEPLDRSTQ